jgi:hypothetical protein
VRFDKEAEEVRIQEVKTKAKAERRKPKAKGHLANIRFENRSMSTVSREL